MAKSSYYNFVTTVHDLYNRYIDDWLLAVRSYWGGVEYREGKYLKAYDVDYTTPSEVISTYEIDDNGIQTGKYSSYATVDSKREADTGDEYNSNFYNEKLHNVPAFPYTRLYVSEYNSVLFRTPPSRTLEDSPEVTDFVMDVDGEGNSINEFMSQVDVLTTVYGVVWISCIKPAGNDYARWRVHTPLDVTNWHYSYSASGELILDKIVIRVSNNDDAEVFQYFTADTIDTIFIPKDPDVELNLPEGTEYRTDGEDDVGYYKITQVNELGYIPVRPVYQSNKIYNGVGHTPIFDIAQIQRSVYSDMGEIYSAVSYGAHGVLVVDSETSQLNDHAISAEPGTTIRVPNSLNGQPNYVFEFVSPRLDSITELRELIDQKIEKMNAVAMVRSDELIRASRSGVQIEQYDSKLEAFIRKKATALENAEYNMWRMWYDWQEKPMPEDFVVAYNRTFSKKGLIQEIEELRSLLAIVTEYEAAGEAVDPDMKAGLTTRLTQLINSSYSENSL